MNFFEKLKAYDFERNQICDVLQIVTSNLNGRNIGEIELNNGYVTFWKNYLTKECIILNWIFTNGFTYFSFHFICSWYSI